MARQDAEVAVIGGGVVGCAVAHALARRGVGSVVFEAEPGLALAASGTNSGILHTGFDSTPGELETQLILRSARLREELLEDLGVGIWRCGARLTARDDAQRAAISALVDNARANHVNVCQQPDGSLRVPGEAVTDPVAFTHALASAARAGGADFQLGHSVVGLAAERGGVAVTLADGARSRFVGAANCAGLYADDIAGLAGDRPAAIYPRKGEFLVFAPAEPLEEILLALPSALGKGVLVFPTVDRLVLAGPTAREREDKRDWSVEPDAEQLIRERAISMWPALERAELIGAYAGLRPAGRDANYTIEPSPTLQGLVHVAAIRSTGLSASLGIGGNVAELLARCAGVELGPHRRLRAERRAHGGQWWRRAAGHHGALP